MMVRSGPTVLLARIPERISPMIDRIRTVSRGSDRGASAVEYGLLVAAIAAVIVVVVFVLGGFIQGAFNDTCGAIEDSTTTTNATGDTCP